MPSHSYPCGHHQEEMANIKAGRFQRHRWEWCRAYHLEQHPVLPQNIKGSTAAGPSSPLQGTPSGTGLRTQAELRTAASIPGRVTKQHTVIRTVEHRVTSERRQPRHTEERAEDTVLSQSASCENKRCTYTHMRFPGKPNSET